MGAAKAPDDEEVLRRVEKNASAASWPTYLAGAKRALRAVGGKSTLCGIILAPRRSFEKIAAATQSPKTAETTVKSLLAIVKHAGLREHASMGGRFARASAAWKALLTGQEGLEVGSSGSSQPRPEVQWIDVVKNNAALAARARRTAWEASKGDAAAARALPARQAAALLSSFYTDMEPRRQSDYWRVYVVRKEKDLARGQTAEPAFIDARPSALRKSANRLPALVVREFKTAKAYGPWRTVLPAPTWRLLRASLKTRPREYVFTRATGEPFNSAHAFMDVHNAHLSKWFGHGVTNRVIRHARATQINRDPMLAPADRERHALAMGHSMRISAKVYATGSRPAVGRDGSFDMTSEVSGRARVYHCAPVAVAAAAAV